MHSNVLHYYWASNIQKVTIHHQQFTWAYSWVGKNRMIFPFIPLITSSQPSANGTSRNNHVIGPTLEIWSHVRQQFREHKKKSIPDTHFLRPTPGPTKLDLTSYAWLGIWIGIKELYFDRVFMSFSQLAEKCTSVSLLLFIYRLGILLRRVTILFLRYLQQHQ